MTMITPSYLGETIEYSSLHACRSTLEDPTMNFHVSFDRTQIVNYGQWKSREAMAAARENPKIVALMSETAKIAVSSKPIPYELRQSVPVAAE